MLTDDGADDACEVPALLDQVEGEIASMTADGACDGEPVYQAIASHQPDPPPDVVVPPRASAVASTEDAGAQGQRDRHILFIAEKGRMAWQRATGHGHRSHAENRGRAIQGPHRSEAARPRLARPAGTTTGLTGSMQQHLAEKHGGRTRRSWRKLRIDVDADTGRIVAAELTANDGDDGSQVGACSTRSALLSPPSTPMARMTGTVFMRRSRHAIPEPRSSCRRVRAR